MESLLHKKDQYDQEFADHMYGLYMKDAHGVTVCRKSDGRERNRKKILEWQSNEDHGALTAVSITYMSWLPITFGKIRSAYIGGAEGYTESNTPIAPVSMQMSYNYGNEELNLVEINTGGCITKINLNPTININGENAKFEHVQSTASDEWVITHNMGFTPNVYTVDANGNEIEGVVTVVSSNVLKINFSAPVSGKAYLS